MIIDLPPQPAAFIQALPEVSRSAAVRAQAALLCAQASGQKVDKFIVFDAGRSANEKRLFVLDVRGEPKLVLSDWVAHGSGSDPDRDGNATQFSNTPNSNATSLGLYRVAERYKGRNPGSSYRLDGLTAGFNTNARVRAVVVHTSRYVQPGRVGRSWGCPALRPEVMEELDELGMQDTMLWIDADGQGLDQSASLNCPAARELVASYERYKAHELAMIAFQAQLDRWVSPQMSIATTVSWGRQPTEGTICVS